MASHGSRQVWQIAGGEITRDYSGIFLVNDVMFLGPGKFGPYIAEKARYNDAVQRGEITRSSSHEVRRFATEVRQGDIILLRLWHHVKAIGLVPRTPPYVWDQRWEDVFGWDLQHSRRVVWQHQLEPELARIQAKHGLFDHMKQVPTFTRVRSPKVLEPLEHLFDQCEEREPVYIKEAFPELSEDQLGRELFAHGLPNDSVDNVLQALQRQRRLAEWYGSAGRLVARPTEHEVVAHMILPLLLALGWSEQLLAVEWHKIDLAAFRATPTTKDNCVLVCEAKGFGHGLQNVLEQALKYHSRHKLSACNKILITDGARLYLYERRDGEWSDEAAGYLNVHHIRRNHLAPPNTNAVDTIVALTPTGVLREVPRPEV